MDILSEVDDGHAVAIRNSDLQLPRVGGISQRPVAVAGAIEVRDILDLTISVDHNLVDGGPAARFTAELRDLIESFEVSE